MSNTLLFNFKVRLEGILVPFDSASVTIRRNSPSVAHVSLAPTPEIAKVLPRTLVDIFFLDPIDRQWRLLFNGEVSDRGRTKQGSQRSFNITAQGVSNHWYRAYLYMLNETAGFTYGDAIRLQGLGGSAPYTAGERLEDLSTLLDPQIENSFKKVAGRIPNVNAFYADVEQRLKILSRMKILSDPEVTQLYVRRQYFDRVFDSVVSSQVSEAAPIIKFLQGFADLIYYDWVEIPSPAKMTSQIIFKPKTYFCPTPRCNVFFPSRYGSLQESRSFLNEPTRLVLTTNLFEETGQAGDIDLQSEVRFAPKELQAKIDEIREKFKGQSDSAEAMQEIRDLHAKVLTEEEKIKGIIPEYLGFSQSEWLVSQDGGNGVVDGSKWLQNIVDYKFYLRKFMDRSASLNHSFNPWVVVGFPGVALDEFGHVFGMIDSVTHSISTRGGSSNIEMTYTLNPEDDQIPGTNAFPELPPWFNSQYKTGSGYNELFGSAPLAASARESSAAVIEAFKKFKSVRNSLPFALSVNRRPIVTEQEFYGFVGASGGDGTGEVQVYSGGPFRSANQVAVRAHINRIGRRSALEGF